MVKETPLLSGRRLQRTIERVIEKSAAETGHKTKPEEMFTSRSVNEFNKQTFINGKIDVFNLEKTDQFTGLLNIIINFIKILKTINRFNLEHHEILWC